LRTIRFLEKMDCAILSSHRKIRPHGLKGGAPGELGATWVRRNPRPHGEVRSGEAASLEPWIEELEGADQTVLEVGEAVIVRTPTGGGYGEP
jgi:5-oxoprolinase (ATP-hydrolysing)